MATPTPAQIVETIDQAISDLSLGKAKTRSIGSRSYTFHDIPDLLDARKYYAGLGNASTATSGTVRPFKMFGLEMRSPSS
jgi:hypothetical protein